MANRSPSHPDELKSPIRDIQIVDGGKALAIRMFDEKLGGDFVLPLPVYLQDAAVTN